uniref:Uncharacterized protein n=1 Tax=Romanomermis culicivorax TaxID=13658 RepID=A0A915K4I7_ROMCU
MHWEVDMQTCVRHSQKICMATERHRKTEMMMKNHLCLCYNFRPHANAQIINLNIYRRTKGASRAYGPS